MRAMTPEMAGKGWMYRIGGYRNKNGYSVIRKMSWDPDDKDAEPEWWVEDAAYKKVGQFINLDDALNFAEATHELSLDQT